ncbi:MAG TPA: FeS-binding protein, partial [Flavobacteriaceae bacterium]|nr:FeS-binding protein [Flavobacteriaceae bacterium]
IFTFSSAIFMGTFSPTKAQLTALMTEKGISSKVFESNAVAALTNSSFNNIHSLKNALSAVVLKTNDDH